MSKQESRACPLCGANSTAHLADITAEQIIESSPYYRADSYTRLGVKPHERYGISSCSECEFVFSSNVPSDEFLSALYDTGDLAQSIQLFARPARAAYAFNSLATLLDAVAVRGVGGQDSISKQAIKILDVGCAYGVGSLGLTRTSYPYEVTGVELSSDTRQYLESQGMTTYREIGDIPEAASFDGVLLNDVLEHVPDPLKFLQALKRVCHSDTVIWVNVPNFIDWRLQAILQTVESGQNNVPTDFNPWEHLSYFSPRSLDSIMSRIGANRVVYSRVKYTIDRSSFTTIIKSLLKMLKDLPKLSAGNYPDCNTTSGLFGFRAK